MSITHARPFSDPRNTVIVDNNDPGAFDKSHAGIAGTHREQRCCDNKAPSRLVEGTGWYVNSQGQRIVNIISYWARPENRAGAKDGWWNAETPVGYYVEMAPTGMLMCDGCFGTAWDQFVDDVSTTFAEMVPVIRGIAMAVSYIPVFGTAISFLLNASVSLAQGASIDAAFLDGIGGALPGQPTSGAAFNAARSLMRGDRIDQVALGLCEGMSVDGPGQQRVKLSLGALNAQHGFYVGQAIQHQRTVGNFRVSAVVSDHGLSAASLLANLQGQAAPPAHLAHQAGFNLAANAAAFTIHDAAAAEGQIPPDPGNANIVGGLIHPDPIGFNLAGIRYRHGDFR